MLLAFIDKTKIKCTFFFKYFTKIFFTTQYNLLNPKEILKHCTINDAREHNAEKKVVLHQTEQIGHLITGVDEALNGAEKRSVGADGAKDLVVHVDLTLEHRRVGLRKCLHQTRMTLI